VGRGRRGPPPCHMLPYAPWHMYATGVICYPWHIQHILLGGGQGSPGPVSPKLVLYACHDWTILPLLLMLSPPHTNVPARLSVTVLLCLSLCLPPPPPLT
jgi:hypothetical protein